MTKYEFVLIEGQAGKGGTPVGVKAVYEMILVKEDETAQDEPEMTEEESPKEEVSQVEEEPQPVEEPELKEQTEPSEAPPKEPEVEKDVTEQEVEDVDKTDVEADVQEEVSEPDVEEPVEEEEPDGVLSGIEINFDPPTPCYVERGWVDVEGKVTGLPRDGSFYLKVRRLDNGTDLVDELQLDVGSERAVIDTSPVHQPVQPLHPL